MMLQKAIDMTRPAAVYLGLIAFLVLAVFIEGRAGIVIVSRHGAFPYQKLLASLVIVGSVGAGLLGARRYAARAAQPWRVPQVQVLLCFALFFVLGFTGVLLSS